jgi:hypothetical protein
MSLGSFAVGSLTCCGCGWQPVIVHKAKAMSTDRIPLLPVSTITSL